MTGSRFTAADVVFTWQTIDPPQDARALQGEVPPDQGGGGARPVHRAGDLSAALRAGARELERVHPAQASPRAVRGRGQAPRVAAEPACPSAPAPYRFKEWRSGEKVVVVANPDYYLGRPYLSRIVYRVIPSQATIFLELKARGVDYSQPHRRAVQAPDGIPGLPQGLRQVPVSRHGLHVLRLQPEGPALRRPARPPGLRARDRQARARRRRGHGAGPRGGRPHPPGQLGLSPTG